MLMILWDICSSYNEAHTNLISMYFGAVFMANDFVHELEQPSKRYIISSYFLLILLLLIIDIICVLYSFR